MLRVRTIFQGPTGAPWYNNLHFVGDTAADAAAAHSATTTFWSAVDALITSQVTWVCEAIVAEIDLATGQQVDAHVVPQTTGTGFLAGEPMPWASQALIRLHTLIYQNGRSVRGRIYVPGLTVSALASGFLATQDMATLDAAAEALVADAGSLFAVYSRTTASAVEVDATSVWNQWAVMRSRRD